MGLYTPTILGGNSYLSWFYDRGAIKDPAHTGTSKVPSQAINTGPIRKFLPKYANVHVTIQGYDLSAGVRTHYVTANGVRNRLTLRVNDVYRLFMFYSFMSTEPAACIHYNETPSIVYDSQIRKGLLYQLISQHYLFFPGEMKGFYLEWPVFFLRATNILSCVMM